MSPGGFVIVDDFGLPTCRAAIEDFRQARGITDPIRQIDWTGVFWQRSMESRGAIVSPGHVALDIAS